MAITAPETAGGILRRIAAIAGDLSPEARAALVQTTLLGHDRSQSIDEKRKFLSVLFDECKAALEDTVSLPHVTACRSPGLLHGFLPTSLTHVPYPVSVSGWSPQGFPLLSLCPGLTGPPDGALEEHPSAVSIGRFPPTPVLQPPANSGGLHAGTDAVQACITICRCRRGNPV